MNKVLKIKQSKKKHGSTALSPMLMLHTLIHTKAVMAELSLAIWQQNLHPNVPNPMPGIFGTWVRHEHQMSQILLFDALQTWQWKDFLRNDANNIRPLFNGVTRFPTFFISPKGIGVDATTTKNFVGGRQNLIHKNKSVLKEIRVHALDLSKYGAEIKGAVLHLFFNIWRNELCISGLKVEGLKVSHPDSCQGVVDALTKLDQYYGLQKKHLQEVMLERLQNGTWWPEVWNSVFDKKVIDAVLSQAQRDRRLVLFNTILINESGKGGIEVINESPDEEFSDFWDYLRKPDTERKEFALSSFSGMTKAELKSLKAKLVRKIELHHAMQIKLGVKNNDLQQDYEHFLRPMANSAESKTAKKKKKKKKKAKTSTSGGTELSPENMDQSNQEGCDSAITVPLASTEAGEGNGHDEHTLPQEISKPLLETLKLQPYIDSADDANDDSWFVVGPKGRVIQLKQQQLRSLAIEQDHSVVIEEGIEKKAQERQNQESGSASSSVHTPPQDESLLESEVDGYYDNHNKQLLEQLESALMESDQTHFEVGGELVPILQLHQQRYSPTAALKAEHRRYPGSRRRGGPEVQPQAGAIVVPVAVPIAVPVPVAVPMPVPVIPVTDRIADLPLPAPSVEGFQTLLGRIQTLTAENAIMEELLGEAVSSVAVQSEQSASALALLKLMGQVMQNTLLRHKDLKSALDALVKEGTQKGLNLRATQESMVQFKKDQRQ